MASTLSPSIPQEILDSLSAIKGVFASAKGPRVIQLQQDVNRIEEYLLSCKNTSPPPTLHQDVISTVERVEEIAHKIEGITQEETVLQVVTDSLRNYLNADRIVVYSFVNSQPVQAIAESVQLYYASLFNQILPDNFFQFESLSSQFKILPSIYEITNSQLEFWRNFQVVSGFLLPLIIEKKLWGVVVIHYCRERKIFSANERILLQQVGMMLNIALKPKSVAPIETPGLSHHLPVENILEPKVPSKTSPLIAFLTEINNKVNSGIVNCKDTLEKLIFLQQNNGISLHKLNILTKEYQQGKQLINLVKKVKESLDILSVNTAIQVTQNNSEEELVSIAEQVEIIAHQAKETVIDIEDWIIELQDLTGILDRSIKISQTDLDIVVKNVEKMRQELEQVVKTTN